MTTVLLNDHLLRDYLSGNVSDELAGILDGQSVATTNFYYLRLCKSVVAAAGGSLTGSWRPEQRRRLGELLVRLPESVRVVPMTDLSFRMAEIGGPLRLSNLGAEALAACESLGATLCITANDDGPAMAAGAAGMGVERRVLDR